MYSIDELKQIQLYRQHLTDKTDKITVCHDLNGIQAQFTVNVEHSLKIRCNEKIEKDNYWSGLVKNWTIRRTVHVFNQDDLPIYKYYNEDNPYLSYNCSMTGDFIGWLRDTCGIRADKLEYIARFIVDKVANIFNQCGGLLRPLCERGFLYYKVQEKKAFEICPTYTPMEKDQAIMEQAIRYFTHFAPATIKDISYYFAWTQTYTKAFIKKLPLLNIQINGNEYYFLDELKSDYPDIPNCIFLAGFDQLMLGYQKSESIYLPPEHLRNIFNLAGIIMPSILLNGKVVGKWKKEKTKLIITLFENISLKDKQSMIQTAEHLWNDIKKIDWK